MYQRKCWTFGSVGTNTMGRCARSKSELPDRFTHLIGGSAQIARRRGDVLVAQKGLNGADVGALLQGAGREGLAEFLDSSGDSGARALGAAAGAGNGLTNRPR